MILPKSVLLSLLAVAPSTVNAILPIHIKNYRFVQPASADNEANENDIFFVKGVDYQPGGSSGYDSGSNSDVLSDPEVCARDVLAFQQLGVNTIRIYSVNPDVNHDKCMTIFNDAGIYLILDVNSGNDGENLNRADPNGSYNSTYLTRVFKMIEAFKNYPNVLGFFSGNEVINDEENYASLDPPYIRAVQRDMKQYIAKHANRKIPVGYSAADNTDLRLATFKYLQCNSLDGKTVQNNLEDSKSDFFGLNTYEWCSGTSDWTSSGYDKLNSTFSDAVIPLVFSEYGCNKNLPRTFDEVTDGLYPAEGLGNLFSGGLVYEYAEEANQYGLVKIDDSDNSITYKDDFANLKDRFDKIDPPTVKESTLSNNTIYKCDASAITSAYSDFGVNKFAIPSQPAAIKSMIQYGLNNTNVGELLSNYTAPTTVSYNVTDNNGDAVTATIEYSEKNKLNHLKAETVSSTNVTSSTSKVSSSKTSTSVSSTITSMSSSSSIASVATSANSSSASSTSSSSGAAAMIKSSYANVGLMGALIAALL